MLNALLCVHGAHACILSCGVLLMLACWCRFSLTTLAGLHVPMLFEWCVQAFPSGRVGPLATAGNKRWELREGTAKGGGRWKGRSSSQEVEVCLVHVMCYACVDRLCTRAAYICCIHRSLQLGCYHRVARNWVTHCLAEAACLCAGFYSISGEYLFWRDCTLRAPNITR